MSGIVTNFVSKVTDFGYAIGFFSEFILLVVVILWLIWKSVDPGIDIVIYVAGLIVSGGINTTLKRWIEQPRPHDPRKFLYSEHFDRRRTVYGMPSAHSQKVFYSIAYLYGSVPGAATNVWIAVTSIVIATLTWIERWQFHNHTWPQLVVGAGVGVAMAYLVLRLRDLLRRKPVGHRIVPQMDPTRKDV